MEVLKVLIKLNLNFVVGVFVVIIKEKNIVEI